MAYSERAIALVTLKLENSVLFDFCIQLTQLIQISMYLYLIFVLDFQLANVFVCGVDLYDLCYKASSIGCCSTCPISDGLVFS